MRSAEPVAPSRLQPVVPRDLNTVCLKCLEKDPAGRYATAADLAADLRRFLAGEPVRARAVGPWGRTWRWGRRNPRTAGLLAALVVALASGFGGVFYQWHRAEELYGLADAQRAAAEANLRRYEQAADDFAALLDRLETDQLFHFRSDPLRPELVIPALRRNQEFLARHGDDPARRPDSRASPFSRGGVDPAAEQRRRTGNPPYGPRRRPAGARGPGGVRRGPPRRPLSTAAIAPPCCKTLAICCTPLDGRRKGSPCWRTPSGSVRRCSTPNRITSITVANSPVAGTTCGLALDGAGRFEEAAAAQDRAAGLQRVAMRAAPQVTRYRRLLCNHLFNRAMALARLGQPADAAEAAAAGRHVAPEDPEQWFREARILALLAARLGARWISGSSAGESAASARPRVRRPELFQLHRPRRLARPGRVSGVSPRIGAAKCRRRVTGPVGESEARFGLAGSKAS